ncbi:MAG: c-type cytochrome domain-containing protein, partial [Planctomycetia bacterium]
MIRTIKSIFIALCVTCHGTATSANDLDLKASRLIVEQCLDCHSGSKPKGGLDLSTKSSATIGGDSGPGLIAQNPETSSIWEVIHSKR